MSINKNKRGVIVIQFNWIYIMIVGGLIIIFFVILANNIRKSSNESLNFDLLNYIDEIMVGIGTSSQFEHEINLPGIDIIANCQHYTIKGSDREGKSLQNRIIFSPNLLKKEIRSYTLYWEAPFKTSFFLFLSSPQMQYIIIDDDPSDDFSYADFLYEELPDNLNIFGDGPIGDLSEYKEENHYKIKIIQFDQSNPDSISDQGVDFGRTKRKDISLINIIPDTNSASSIGLSFPDGSGEVKFYRYDGTNFIRDGSADEYYGGNPINIGYLNKASLFGAIYAQDAFNYDCNMAKALKRLSHMSAVLNNKISDISINGNVDSSCNYNMAINQLDLYSSIADKQDIQKNIIDTLFEESYGQNKLVDSNQELQRLSCPMIY